MGDGGGCSFRTLRICTPKLVTQIIFHTFRSQGQFDAEQNQKIELVF